MMTNEEILAMLEKAYGRPARSKPALVLRHLDELRKKAKSLEDLPAQIASLKDQEKKLRAAERALRKLPDPYLGFYWGIADHLFLAMNTVIFDLATLDESPHGHPAKIGKRSLIKLCNDAIKLWFPANFSGNPPGRTILTFDMDVRPEAPYMAKAIWDKAKAETKPAGIESWKKLTKKATD